ncbi:MAG: acyltransferase [Akkermansiaceae bacterium]|nr:acyltransferase [Akkermansiaceae bacterium]
MSAPPNSGYAPARVDELDGLRGLLALWVAFSHIFALTGYWDNPGPKRLNGAWEIFVSAGPAVDTFIILSGFAISFLLHKRRQSYVGFMRGRVFRIYPVYLFCLALAIGTGLLTPFILQTASWKDTIYFTWMRTLADQEASAFGSHLFWHLTLLNGLLTKEFLPGATGTILVPAWSITLEWQYYLVAPFLARGVKSGLGLLVIGLIAMAGFHYKDLWQNPQLSFFPAQLPLFLIGIGSYHLYANLSDSEKFRPLASVSAVALLLLGVIAQWHPVALAAWAIGFGCIVVRGNDIISKLLGLVRVILLLKPLQLLGTISFPLYLVHWPVVIAVLYGMLKVSPGMSSPVALVLLTLISVPIMLIAAYLIHRLVEKPGMNLGKRFDKRPASVSK